MQSSTISMTTWIRYSNAPLFAEPGSLRSLYISSAHSPGQRAAPTGDPTTTTDSTVKNTNVSGMQRLFLIMRHYCFLLHVFEPPSATSYWQAVKSQPLKFYSRI